MRLEKRDWRKSPVKFSIDEAVEHVCDGSDYDRGQLETVSAHATNISRKLGELVELLHRRGLLDDAAVLDFLGGDWHAAEEP